MKLLRPKFLVLVLILLFAGGYLFLSAPYYFVSLVKYKSISGSGLVYSIKGRGDIDQEASFLDPASTEFGLIITKLGLNEKVVEEVEFYDPVKLKAGLRRGLAHVKSSALPGDFGAVLIVGHPLNSFFNTDRLHPDFYLVNKLAVGDEIVIYYHDRGYVYQVAKKSFAPPTYLDFFDPGEEKKLVLVSGYPPGMAVRLLVIEAEPVN
ncbi:MAG TPA: sortase [Candidatus Bathyarchaeia archaeon]|nr:sortase [Candidatus Bathyarchaeia archaeon]